jgi:hypothetical protein
MVTGGMLLAASTKHYTYVSQLALPHGLVRKWQQGPAYTNGSESQQCGGRLLVADGGTEELGGVVEAVHVPGVSDVLLPVLDWALACLQSLHHTKVHESLLLQSAVCQA